MAVHWISWEAALLLSSLMVMVGHRPPLPINVAIALARMMMLTNGKYVDDRMAMTTGYSEA
jgi:hypothetical protein